jgi:hypothetical protein
MPREKYIEYYLTFPNAKDIYGQTYFTFYSYEKAVEDGEKIKLEWGHDYKIEEKENIRIK